MHKVESQVMHTSSPMHQFIHEGSVLSLWRNMFATENTCLSRRELLTLSGFKSSSLLRFFSFCEILKSSLKPKFKKYHVEVFCFVFGRGRGEIILFSRAPARLFGRCVSPRGQL